MSTLRFTDTSDGVGVCDQCVLLAHAVCVCLVRVTVRRARTPLRFVLRCRPHPLPSLTLPCFSAMLWVWL